MLQAKLRSARTSWSSGVLGFGRIWVGRLGVGSAGQCVGLAFARRPPTANTGKPLHLIKEYNDDHRK